jgi:predicted nucleic acid-binding protein
MKSRFDELLPFYVNGTLNADDRVWIEHYLREHPQAANELSWLRSVQTMTQEEVVPVSSEVGLGRAMQRIRAERTQAAPVAATSFVERVRDWLASLLPQPMLKPALAGALAVIALQAVIITAMVGEREDTSLIRGVPPVGATEPPAFVKVNFRPDATEADIRMLLIDAQANIASGPGQLGDYYVRVSAWQVDAVTALLGASSIVEGVAVVDALPAWPQ